MPYDSNEQLPAHVQKLSAGKQRQWRHVFNSYHKSGKGEGTCMAMANGVVKKSLDNVAGAADYAALPELRLGDFASDADVMLAEKAYQYVDSYEYESRKLSQADAGYNAVGGGGTKACSNCMFFISPARCAVVGGEIAPNGLSSSWRAVPTHEPEPMPVVIVDWGLMAEKQTSILGRLGHRLFGKPDETSGSADAGGMCIFQQKDGALRWVARYSNALKDKEHELIVQAAHKEYIDWVYETGNFPELCLWHTPGTRFGEADWLDYSDGFAHASGLVDTGAEHVVEALAKQKSVGVSHGFLSWQTSDGYVEKYRTYEISVLPAEHAAAWGTDFALFGKDENMAFSEKQRKWLVDAVGEKAVAALEKSTGEVAAGLAGKVEFKEIKAPEAPASAPKSEEGSGGAVVDPTVQLKAITDPILQSLTTLTGVLGDVAGAVAVLTKEVGELKTSDKERLDRLTAENISPRVMVAAGARPTADGGNVLDTKEVVAAGLNGPADFLASTIMKQIGAIPPMGVAGVTAQN